ncbi:MAG TPA: ABC transporter permease, partial [Tissierellaceae bacterium]|nr:ABC transporter permease [Tissierellaceae bacterium]
FVIMGVIFIATSLAIFQIFLTQIKRRSRKLVLLRAIGATKRQIIGIILYEGLYFLTRGLIIGVPIGFISVLSLLYGMNRIGGRDLKFYVDIRLLIPGLIAGILSLFLGMIIPMIYAVRIPLVGSMNRPSRSKSSYNKKRSTSYQSFNRINWEYIKANRGKTLLSFGISFVTITILLSSLFLCYYSFDNYKKLVLKPGRPDYALETYYGESYRKLLEQKKELLNIDGVENAYAYKVGRELHFWYEDINNNEMLKDFDKLLPADLRKVYFTKHNSNLKKMEVEPFISDAFLSKIYGIDPDSDLFKKYESFLTRGNIDREKFNAGEEVIILSPMYIKGEKNSIDNINLNKNTILDLTNEDNRMSWIFENTGSYKLSYDKQDSNHYIKQDFLKVGDRIQLSSSKEEVTAQSYESSFVTKQFKVAGIIDYFPQGSQWPFYHSKANYIVISSIRAMEDIYPFTVRGLGNFEPASMKAAVDTIYPNRYGRTLWYIDTDSKKQDVVLDSKLLAYAHNNNYTIYNYKESNAKLYQESFNNALIISLLGITASAIAFIILYNILESQMEQDRNRIGILQALGVTKKEFSTYYIKLGLINGILALGLINIILMTIMLISSNKNMHLLDRIKDALIYRLWLYPWLVHILLSVAFLSLTVLIYYLPARKVIENSPVENIRSLSR